MSDTGTSTLARARNLVDNCEAIQLVSGAVWHEKAVEVLAPMLLAAELQGHSMQTIAQWGADPTDRAPLEILEAYPQYVPVGWTDQLRRHYDNSPARMQESTWNLAGAAVTTGDE